MTDTKNIYWSAIETFGYDLQIAVAIEEMAELTKELCKAQRVTFAGRGGLGDGLIDNYDEIAEEIADVQIVLDEADDLDHRIWFNGLCAVWLLPVKRRCRLLHDDARRVCLAPETDVPVQIVIVLYKLIQFDRKHIHDSCHFDTPFKL